MLIDFVCKNIFLKFVKCRKMHVVLKYQFSANSMMSKKASAYLPRIKYTCLYGDNMRELNERYEFHIVLM